MRIILNVEDGPHRGRSFAFEQHDNFIVGRASYAHFRLPQKDKYFSRVHFMVEINPPWCRLVDMASRNGTYVNGRSRQTADLSDGDLIRAGRTTIRVSIEDADGMRLGTTVTLNPQSPATPATGEEFPQIPGYQVLKEVGRGGMGVVYCARRESDQATVAVKVIRSANSAASAADVQRFLREAEILRQLEHPHIVRFAEMGESQGLLHFVMEYVSGLDARQLLRRTKRPLSVPRAVDLVCQLLKALKYAHDRGFVHRDIKPSNILLTEVDGSRRVKLADFGLARSYLNSRLSGLTMFGEIGGTIHFMPPEQITNFREATPFVDQYATAATLYFLLTRKYLYDFPRDLAQQILLILQDEPVPLRSRRPDLPEPLAAVVHRALARTPELRFADVVEFRRALLPFRGQPQSRETIP